MPEEVQQTQAATPPGWIAGLPDQLKANETFSKYKTVGDFASDYLAVSQKATELEQKVSNSIPKLKDDASPEERSQFFDALGRPKEAKEYEFEGEDKNAPEWTSRWKQNFHEEGLTKAQGKNISAKFNTEIQAIVDRANANFESEKATAASALKSEWGDKFDTNVELAKRVYQKLNLTEFDKDFDEGTGKTRFATLRLLMKVAAATGEDRSPQGANGLPDKGAGNPFPNSKMPPART